VAGPMAPLISRTVAVAAAAARAPPAFAPPALAAPALAGAALFSAGWDAAAGAPAARTDIGIIAMITVEAITAKAARTALTRSWERAEQAFTLLTLLPSYAGRSRWHLLLAYLRGEPGRARWEPRGAFERVRGGVGRPVCCVLNGRLAPTFRRPSASSPVPL